MSTPSQQHQLLARNFTWLSLQEFLIRLLGLATAIYLARTLSTASYGQLGIALAMVGIIGTLVQAGTGSRATRQTAVNPNDVPEIYAQLTGFRLVSAAIFISVFLLLAPLLADIFSVSSTLLMLCSLLLLRRALTVVWAFRGLDQMHVNAVADVVEKALLLLGLVLLVRGEGNDVLWAPVVEITASLLMIWWLRLRLGRIYPGLAIGFRISAWPEIAREALPLGLAGLLASFYINGVVPLLGWLGTADEAARFLVAQKIMLTLTLLLFVINQAAFPSASRLLASAGNGIPADDESRDRSAVFELTARLFRYYLVAITPLFLLVLLYSEELLALLFGSAYYDAGPVLIILLSALPFLAINNNMLFLLRAIPKPGSVLTSRIVGTAALLAISAWLIPVSGARGAAIAMVSAEFSAMLVLLYLLHRATGNLPWNLRCLSPFLSGAAALLIYFLSDGWAEMARLALAAIAYIVVSFLTRAVSIEELRLLSQLLLAILRRPFR